MSSKYYLILNIFFIGLIFLTGCFLNVDDLQYVLTVDIEGKGIVLEPGEGGFEFIQGKIINLEAEAEEGWTFYGWQGDIEAENRKVKIDIDGDKEVRAVFKPKNYNVELGIEGNGSVDIKGYESGDVDAFPYEEVLSIEAVPDEGWEFKRWSGELSSSEELIELEVRKDKKLTAIFEPIDYVLAVQVEGKGSINIEPEKEVYNYGDRLELSKIPEKGWIGRWGGDIEKTQETPLIITVEDDMQIKALFSPREYDISVVLDGEGEVDLEPDNQGYLYGDRVELTASGSPGWSFSHWEGDISGNENPIQVTVASDFEASAVFEKEIYQLKTEVNGEASLFVHPEQDYYYYGTEVMLKVEPREGWKFSGWNGSVADEDNQSTSLIMTNDTVINAVIEKKHISEQPVFMRPVLRDGDRGDEVKYLQKRLAELGFMTDDIDGHFGLQTMLGVKKAQQYFGLKMDGVVGTDTWSALKAAKVGGDYLYTVRSGDSLWILAQRWNTSVQRVKDINNLGTDIIRLGDNLRIPGRVDMREVKDLNWFDEVSRLFLHGDVVILTDVESGLSFRVRRLGGTNHADVEPLTLRDTRALRQIYGGSFSWERRPVIVLVGDKLIAGSINGMPHGGQAIYDNLFDGHICLHFRGSRLHVNNSSDPEHQNKVMEAAAVEWPF